MIDLPIATYTSTYGLDDSGHPTLEEKWSTPDGSTVPMITKAGMLTMGQQTLAMETMHDPNGEEA